MEPADPVAVAHYRPMVDHVTQIPRFRGVFQTDIRQILLTNGKIGLYYQTNINSNKKVSLSFLQRHLQTEVINTAYRTPTILKLLHLLPIHYFKLRSYSQVAKKVATEGSNVSISTAQQGKSGSTRHIDNSTQFPPFTIFYPHGHKKLNTDACDAQDGCVVL